MLLCLLSRPVAAAPRAVLVLRPELTVEAVFGPGTPFAALLPRAAIGVMNAAVRGPRVPAAAYLTLGAGERLPAGPLTTPARWAAERVEGDPAAVVYARRWGPPPRGHPKASPPALLHPDWAAFLNAFDAEYTPEEKHAAGGLGQALRPHGGIAWLGVGEAARTRRGALTALDAAGTVPWAATVAAAPESSLPDRVAGLLHQAPLVVLDLPPSFSTDRLAALLAALRRDPGTGYPRSGWRVGGLDLLLVSPYPPPGPHGAWDRLPPLLGWGPDFPPGTLTSATTRTAGLVANIDVAPTLLAALRVSVPETMRGRVMRSEPPGNPAAVLRFARQATLAQRAIVPLGIGVGAAAVVPLLLALLAFGGRSRRIADCGLRIVDCPAKSTAPMSESLSLIRNPQSAIRNEAVRNPQSSASPRLAAAASLSLRLVAAAPLGLLLAPVTGPQTVIGLGIAVAAWSAAAALGITVTPGLRHRPLPGLYALTVAVVAGDLLLGGKLVARSPLSGFAVAGIRFYGVGNEYLGVLIGMGLLAPLTFEDRLARGRWLQAGLFLGLLLLIGSPQYGANLGGPLAAAAGFGTTLLLARRPRRPLLALALLGAAVVAVGAAVFLWDALRASPLRSHIGDFAHAVSTGGWSAAAPVLRRKAAMDFRLLTSGFALVPIAAVTPLLVLWYRNTGRGLSTLLAHRPELRAATGGALAAAWTALLCKDSGISPWLFITVSLLALLLDEQLRALPPSPGTTER